MTCATPGVTGTSYYAFTDATYTANGRITTNLDYDGMNAVTGVCGHILTVTAGALDINFEFDMNNAMSKAVSVAFFIVLSFMFF